LKNENNRSSYEADLKDSLISRFKLPSEKTSTEDFSEIKNELSDIQQQIDRIESKINQIMIYLNIPSKEILIVGDK
jgi:peptidoglycan hydrolase CwlO-like protein